MNKQETLEEAAERYARDMWGVYYDDKHPDVAIIETQGEISLQDFIEGAKWQSKRMYSEEEVLDILFSMSVDNPNHITEWFEKFKNK